MTSNTPERAEFWADFILKYAEYPAYDRLKAQFENAVFDEFCECGCNSFRVNVDEDAEIELLARPGERGGAVFQADFAIKDDHYMLGIILFADKCGRLNYVEVDYCGNSFPVPDDVHLYVTGLSRTWASETLLP